MRVWVLLCLFGCGSGGVTVDMVEGEYAADLALDAELNRDITLKDPDDAWLFVTFFDPEPKVGRDELWADINLDAQVLVFGQEIDENSSDPIQGVTVDGLVLDCQLKLSLATLKVEGEFSEDMQELSLEVEKLGSVRMTLVVPEAETECENDTEEAEDTTEAVPEECEAEEEA